MIPGVALTTDMIVGFPTETETDFEETMSLARAVQYESIYSFKYSPRPNTLALKKMPEDVTTRTKRGGLSRSRRNSATFKSRCTRRPWAAAKRCWWTR
jgi:tRNA A37 methylthiotransferase MiaB